MSSHGYNKERCNRPLDKQIQALKDNPGKRGPNDLEQRIERVNVEK